MNPVLALILANIIWGAAFPIFKYALTDIPPFTLAFVRFIGAGIIFLPFILNYPYKTVSKRDWIEIFLGAIFGITINISFLFLGLEKAPSINASIIGSSSPLFIFLISVLFLHERPKVKVFNGMFISLLGVLTIIFSPFVLTPSHGMAVGEMTGNVYFVISRIGYILGTVILVRTLKRVSPFVVTGVGFWISGVTFLPYMLPELQHWSFSQIHFPGLVGIFFGTIFSSALGYYFFYYGLSKISTQESGIFMYIDPIATVLIAMPLLAEYPNFWFLVGSFLVFVGIYMSEGRIHYHPFHKLKKN